MFDQMVWTAIAFAAQASAVCSRTSLEKAVSAYLSAQAAGQPSLLMQTNDFTYAENDIVMDIDRGVLSQAVTIDFSRSIFDTEQCFTFTEISAATNHHPYVINTRMILLGDRVASIQSVIADSGDWVFNATSHLFWAKTEKWDAIPEGKRDTRTVIKAAGDAYLDSWADGKVNVPYGTPCARLEGGAYTGERNTSSNSCRMPEFPKPFAGAGNRRYVIDEELGAVGILNDFPFIDTTRPAGTPSANFLRVEGAMIRFIHETTVCATRNCGR
jgi:hypothetical protein